MKFKKIRILKQRYINKGFIKASKIYELVLQKMVKRHARELDTVIESTKILANILENRIDEYGQLITKKEDEINNVRRFSMSLENKDDRRVAIVEEIIRNTGRLKDYNNGYDETVIEFRKKFLGHA